jgi:iron complex transport system substrate-binding protein
VLIHRWIQTALIAFVVVGGIIIHWERGSPFLQSAVAAPQAAIHNTPTRIVSLLPSLTEIIFAIDEGHRVVGVSDFDDFPHMVTQLPSVGGLINPNLEAIVALEPDLIVADQSHSVNGSVFRLRELGLRIEVFSVTTAMTFEDLYRVFKDLGRILDATEAARNAVQSMRRSIAEVRQQLSGVTPVTFYCELWANPIIAVPGGSFEGHVLELAGGDNIAASLLGRSPRIGTEFVLQQDPSVILLPGGGIVTGMASPEMIAARPGWKHLQAVEQGRVYTTHHAYFSRHGPRSVLAVQEIARLLHPELAWD